MFAALAGSALTFVFQTQAARQAEQFARERHLWSERIAAYSAFAAALTDFRRVQNDRWHLEQEDAAGSQFVTARDESYRLRAAATAALCRVRLLSGNVELNAQAQGALEATTEVHLAHDEQDRLDRGDRARLALEESLALAEAASDDR